jgi:hypothetical protein
MTRLIPRGPNWVHLFETGAGQAGCRHFRSWLRTLRQDQYPSEQVVATALSSSISKFLMVRHQDHETAKILALKMAPERFFEFVMGKKLCA